MIDSAVWTVLLLACALSMVLTGLDALFDPSIETLPTWHRLVGMLRILTSVTIAGDVVIQSIFKVIE